MREISYVFYLFPSCLFPPPPHFFFFFVLNVILPLSKLSITTSHCISELVLNYRYVVYDAIHLCFTYKIKQLTPSSYNDSCLICCVLTLIYLSKSPPFFFSFCVTNQTDGCYCAVFWEKKKKKKKGKERRLDCLIERNHQQSFLFICKYR